MSLMTSLYPSQHDVVDTDLKLSERIVTLAEILKKSGYRTAAFTGGHLVSKVYGFGRGFDLYRESYPVRIEDLGQGWRLSHMLKDVAFWLDGQADNRFFLFLHFYDIHEPFIANSFLKEFESGYNGRLDFLNNHAAFTKSEEYKKYQGLVEGHFTINLFYSRVINEKRMELSEEDIGHINALYDNEIRYADYFLAKLLAHLEQLQLMKKTIIILWSDHGEELMERGQIQHGQLLFDEQIHVPLILTIPGYSRGQRESRLAQSIDIAPTILDILRLPPQRQFQGISLFSAENPFIIGEQTEQDIIRTRKYKLMSYTRKRRWELFDIEKDPGELNDVASRHPGLVAQMEKDLRQALSRTAKAKPEKIRLDAETIERLRALGYIK
jgi:arylsulfatase A-like enzyme